jgi:hypothetical protein
VFKYLATVFISISVVILSALSVYASEITINDVNQTSDGKISVKCSISEESDSQRITVISCEEGDETHTEDVVYIDEFVPEITDGEFSFEFEPASWVTYNKGYILRIGGNDINNPAELAIVYINNYIVIAGDVNGDGKISRADLNRLNQYFAGWDVKIDEDASDVNGDGRLSRADLNRLNLYFAGWDVVLGQ